MHYKGIICFHNLNFFYIYTSHVLGRGGCCWGCRQPALPAGGPWMASALCRKTNPQPRQGKHPQKWEKTEANQLLHDFLFIFFTHLIIAQDISADRRGSAAGPLSWIFLPRPKLLQSHPTATGRPVPAAGADALNTEADRRRIFICKVMFYGRL